jgi:hypothetical protein
MVLDFHLPAAQYAIFKAQVVLVHFGSLHRVPIMGAAIIDDEVLAA